MLRPLVVLLLLAFAIAGAACVLNGQPTPPETEASNKSDATAGIDPEDPIPTNDSKGFDASSDGGSRFGDATDDALDASSDVLEGGG